MDVMVDALAAEDPDAAVLPYMLSAGTDNKSLSRLGIVGYGFVQLRLPPELDFPAMFHGVDERVRSDRCASGHRCCADCWNTTDPRQPLEGRRRDTARARMEWGPSLQSALGG